METKKLSRILLEKGLVERAALERVTAGLKPDEMLSDRLVSEAILTEADLLRAIAQATGTKFISSPRLTDLQLSPAVLEMIPVAAAQANDVLPINFNAAAKALTVAIADPDRVSALDDLPRVGNLDQVVANVALPSAIRAAIKRVYGLDRRAAPPTSPEASSVCPQCSEPVFGDQLECGSCGLLLNPNAPTDASGARIVRALLSQPSGLHRVKSKSQGHEGATRRGFVQQISDDQIPELVAGVDIARSLSDFEAFLISFVDGRMTVGDLSHSSGLMAVEAQSVIASLCERRVLQLRSSPPPPPPPTGPEAATPAPPDVAPLEPPTPPVPHEPMPERTRNPRRERPRPVSKPVPPVPPAAVVPPPPPPPAAAPKPAAPLLPPRHMDPNVQMENSLQHALALERRGQIDGAISVLRIAVSRAKNPAPLYNRLALVILNQRQDARQAEQLIQKALELDPENPVYRANLVKVLGYAATQGKR